jgi:hypothetical protein
MHDTLKLSWDLKKEVVQKKKQKPRASTSIFIQKYIFDCPNENFQMN